MKNKSKSNTFCSTKLLSISIPIILFNLLSFAQSEKLTIENIIERTLANNPNIRISQYTSLSKFSQFQSSLTTFDPHLSLSANYNKNKDPIQFGLEILQPEQESIRYSASVIKKFDWGLSIVPSLSVTQNDATLGSLRQAITQSRFNFKVEIPLLRNRGFLGTGAYSKAAETIYNSSIASVKFSISEQIKNSLYNYLNIISSVAKTRIYKESENRAENLIELTKVLIKADKKPARELDLVEANLAEKRRSRINSEKNVFDARQFMILQIGMDSESIETDISESQLQEYYGQKVNLNQNTAIQIALSKREDLNSLFLQTDALKLLQANAERNLLNELNLNFNVGYAGLTTSADLEDLYKSIYPENKGMSYSVGLTYELPFNNYSQESDLISRRSDYEISTINLANLKRVIRSDVLTSINNLRLTKLELDQADNSVELFKVSYENETLKQEKGLSTFFDVDQTEQKLTNALLNQINARTNFLKAIINFKHVTGTLLEVQNVDSYSVDVENLFYLKNN